MLYDLPKVIAGAPAYLAQAGVAHRVEVVSGSFFDGVPVGHDFTCSRTCSTTGAITSAA
jgi:hypothetical protein